MPDQITLLLIEDSTEDALYLKKILSETVDFIITFHHIPRLQESIAYLQNHAVDVILLDLWLPDSEGLATLRDLQTTFPSIPIIALTGVNDEAFSPYILVSGAQDYLIKNNIDAELLTRSIRYAIYRKKGEEALIQANLLRTELEKEREIRELKSRFIEMVSHEFRTPLTKILSSVSLLELNGERMPLEKKQRHYRKIQNATIDMTELLDSILVFNIAQSDQARLDLATTHIETFCREILDDFALIIGNSHPLKFIHEGNACEYAHFDPPHMKHILTSLLSNAVKYSPPGSEIILTLHCTDDQVIFEVTDHGIGIPEIDYPSVFKLLHRGTNVGVVSGIGVGLALAQRLANKHGGGITFTSQLNKGSTFTVKIPINITEETREEKKDETTVP